MRINAHIIVFLVLAPLTATSVFVANAQTLYTPGGTVGTSSNSNVGIGTTSPAQLLHVYGTSNPRLLVEGGVGTNPEIWLKTHGAYGRVNILNGSGSGLWSIGREPGNIFTIRDSSNARLAVNQGNVGIGTTTPSHKLEVNGTIRTKEVIVESTGWPDYVFDESYALASLGEIEQHIREHKHLPGLPSAAQVAEKGVSLGEMQTTLLRKLEEVTLHLIEQNRINAEQAEEIRQLRAELIDLRKDNS